MWPVTEEEYAEQNKWRENASERICVERIVSCPACNKPIETPNCHTFCRLFAEAELTKEYRKKECKLCGEINANKAEILNSILDGESICISSGPDKDGDCDDDGEPLWKISISGRKDELAKLHEWLRDS